MNKAKPKTRSWHYQWAAKDKIRNLAEAKKCDDVLIKHYTFILEHFDDIIAKHDKEIAIIDGQKAEILKQFIEAPERLKELNRHLAEMIKKIGDTKDVMMDKKQKIKRIKSLRERLAVLQQECEDEGIDVEAVLNEI